jgi:hypothetical protein
MLSSARQRAKAQGVPFSLTEADIDLPMFCPILGTLLRVNEGLAGPDSPSLDKIDPALGYVPGNVVVVSQEANRLKDRMTPDEMIRIGLAFKELQQRALAARLTTLHGERYLDAAT